MIDSINALIIADLEEFTTSVSELLTREGINIYTADNGRAGINIASRTPIHLVITGMVMPGMQGLEIISEIKNIDEDTVIWVATEERNFNLECLVQAMKLGADDFFIVFRDFPMEKIRKSLQAFLEKIALVRENLRLQKQVSDGEMRDVLHGNCEQVRSVINLIHKVAPTEVPILITGESGTGKEVVAISIWELSDRRNKSYIPINCGAIPETLLESELFGHEKGAFTGAHITKIGKLESANGGTVFLDEIGEMPLNLQVKLLRFLQEGEIQRLGGSKTIHLNLRIISATNKNLETEIAAGRFREDLFYRLNVINIHLPPLRERGTDTLVLANFFLRTLAEKERRQITGFSPLALSHMQQYNWPGNIRELKHRIHRAVILAPGKFITARELGFTGTQSNLPAQDAYDQLELLYQSMFDSAEKKISLKKAKDLFELGLISDALAASNGNISKAAQLLGIARQQLQRFIRKHGINPQIYRSSYHASRTLPRFPTAAPVGNITQS